MDSARCPIPGCALTHSGYIAPYFNFELAALVNIFVASAVDREGSGLSKAVESSCPEGFCIAWSALSGINAFRATKPKDVNLIALTLRRSQNGTRQLVRAI
jgi:hypothetical protein